MNKIKTEIIIVLYHPTEEDITHIKELAETVEGVVVDNSDKPSVSGHQIGKMTYFSNGANLGIAEAQNIGLHHILENSDATHVVFLDQDSRVPVDFPQQMADAFQRIASKRRLAILGPRIIHKESQEVYKSVIHHDTVTDDGWFIRRRDVISSGSCISREALDHVGFMDSSLFIDAVDYDWCWRAEAMGYECGITPHVTIRHQVGKKEFHIGKYLVIISAPFRYYYQYRNYFWLLRRKYVPLQWKIATGVKYTARFIYFPLLVKGGRDCWKHMCRGIKDGIKVIK
ncbi:MAG: glycosyltransferase family 2 protein [Prevotella sp.]|nr:glycosyltransferase family 2 protein [Prevotella sp.]